MALRGREKHLHISGGFLCLAFFEVPGSPFDFKRQDSLDLHVALGVEPETFDAMLDKAKAEGREVRGPVDHRFVRSIYFAIPMAMSSN